MTGSPPLAECYLNEAVLYAAMGRKPRHCTGFSRCIRRLRLRGRGKPGLLLVDRETGRPQEAKLEAFLEKEGCQEACRNRVVTLYSCRGGVRLLVFNAPPEELLAQLGHRVDVSLRRLLKSQRVVDEAYRGGGTEARRAIEELAGYIRSCIGETG